MLAALRLVLIAAFLATPDLSECSDPEDRDRLPVRNSELLTVVEALPISPLAMDAWVPGRVGDRDVFALAFPEGQVLWGQGLRDPDGLSWAQSRVSTRHPIYSVARAAGGRCLAAGPGTLQLLSGGLKVLDSRAIESGCRTPRLIECGSDDGRSFLVCGGSVSEIRTTGESLLVRRIREFPENVITAVASSSEDLILVSHCGGETVLTFEGRVLWESCGARVFPPSMDVFGRMISIDGVAPLGRLSTACCAAHGSGTRFLVCRGTPVGKWELVCIESLRGRISEAWKIPLPGPAYGLLESSGLVHACGGMLDGNEWQAGWVVRVDKGGSPLGQVEIPAPGRFIDEMDGLIVVHGFGRGFVVLTPELRQLWISDSPVTPVALLTADTDADGSSDAFVVGLGAPHSPPAWDIEGLKTTPGSQGGVPRVSENVRLLDQASTATLFLSNAGRLLSRAKEQERKAIELSESDTWQAIDSLLSATSLYGRLGRFDDARRVSSKTRALVLQARAVSRKAATFPLVAGATAAAVLLAGLGYSLTRRAAYKTVLVASPLASAGVSLAFAPSLAAAGPYLSVAASVLAGIVGLKSGEFLQRKRESGGKTTPQLVEELREKLAAFRHGGFGRRSLEDLPTLLNDLTPGSPVSAEYARMLDRIVREFNDAVYGQLMDIARLLRLTKYDLDLGSTLEKQAGVFSEHLLCLAHVLAANGILERSLRDTLAATAQNLHHHTTELRNRLQERPMCSLSEVLDAVLTSKAETLESAGVLVLPGSRPGGEDSVYAPRSDLLNVVENLISNAAKAMEGSPEKKLRCDVVLHRRRAILLVSDTGSGIPRSRRKRIFEHRGTSDAGGFGLPWSRRALRKYGGLVRVKQSRPGKGTVMEVALVNWAGR
ncbi:MAG: hypothetical protein JW952_08855 [Candidatus Eisenbacteria bacterium]|nr:hypothetical protein [Candidatus Eisenbacteria bacterium]